MNNNFREGLNALREISNPELIKLALEKITGKKLADYEGVNALVGALMGYYNDEVKKKLTQGTVPNSLNSAEKIIQALQGNGGLQFDENLLYLNDAGTKKKGFYYLDKLKNGIFECLEQTTVTVNDSSKFKDISNKSNSDRLDNLCETIIENDITYKKFIDGTMIVSGYHLCNRSGVLQLQYPFLNNKYYIGLVTNSNNGSSINPVGVTVASNTANKIYFVAEGSVTFTFIAVGDWK